MGGRAADFGNGVGLPAGRAAPRRAGAGRRRQERSALILLGLAGWSGSGKTTLLTRLLPLLRQAGLRVSTMKRTHHSVDLDQPGKDSFLHRQAGAEEVMVVSGSRWALLRETPEQPPLRELAARLAPVDLLLVEGFKTDDFPKIEIHRPALGKPPLWPTAPGIVAVASDDPLLTCAKPLLPLNDATEIARFVAGFVAAQRGAA